MTQWMRKGIATGIRTTDYPARPETAAGVSPGLPLGGDYSVDQAESLTACCPTHALDEQQGRVSVDRGRCVHCYRCRREVEAPLAWSRDYEWAETTDAAGTPALFGNVFRRSIHIIVVDAGDCGACLNEVRQLNNPFYNMHRLGFFITPTPRHADVLLVVGAVTRHMRVALEKTYDAMPTPKRVLAVGACALSGGVFGTGFASEGAAARVLPVDVEVPGQPPPPLAILHGLLVVTGRKAPASVMSAGGAR